MDIEKQKELEVKLQELLKEYNADLIPYMGIRIQFRAPEKEAEEVTS